MQSVAQSSNKMYAVFIAFALVIPSALSIHIDDRLSGISLQADKLNVLNKKQAYLRMPVNKDGRCRITLSRSLYDHEKPKLFIVFKPRGEGEEYSHRDDGGSVMGVTLTFAAPVEQFATVISEAIDRGSGKRTDVDSFTRMDLVESSNKKIFMNGPAIHLNLVTGFKPSRKQIMSFYLEFIYDEKTNRVKDGAIKIRVEFNTGEFSVVQYDVKASIPITDVQLIGVTHPGQEKSSSESLGETFEEYRAKKHQKRMDKALGDRPSMTPQELLDAILKEEQDLLDLQSGIDELLAGL